MEKTLIKGFHHVSVNTGDFDRSCKFYSEILGLEAKINWIHNGKRAVMFDCSNNNIIEIFEVEEHDPSVSQPGHFALRTTNCCKVLDLVKDFGLEITHELEDVVISSEKNYHARIAFFKGPSGELIELFESNEI